MTDHLLGRWNHRYEAGYWGDVTAVRILEDGTAELTVDWDDCEQTTQSETWMRRYYNPPT
jgi:hypothetical protein